MKTQDLLVLGAAGAVVYFLLGKTSAFALSGPASNAQQGEGEGAAARAYNPEILRSKLATVSAEARDITETVKATPSAGFFLGLDAQSIDYLTLAPKEYQSLYAFNPPGSVEAPAAQ